MSEQFSRSKSSVHPISSLSANKQSAADEGSDVESIDELRKLHDPPYLPYWCSDL